MFEYHIMQMADGGLPTGGFAFSQGLEAAAVPLVVLVANHGDPQSLGDGRRALSVDEDLRRNSTLRVRCARLVA